MFRSPVSARAKSGKSRRLFFSWELVSVFLISILFEAIFVSYIHVSYMKFKHYNYISFILQQSEAARGVTITESDFYVAVTNENVKKCQYERARTFVLARHI